MTRLHLSLLAALVLALGGCDTPKPDYTIVVIPKGMTHEHWQSVRRGAERCAADMADEGISVRIIFDGPLRERDAMEQIRIVDRRVATGADGIVIAPQHSKTMTACVKRAAEAGVPVVIIDSGPRRSGPLREVRRHGQLSRRRELAGEHLIETLKKEGKDKPKLILFRYAVGFGSNRATREGLRGRGTSRLSGSGVALDGQVCRRDARFRHEGSRADGASVQGSDGRDLRPE